jgi:alkaline phosphatase
VRNAPIVALGQILSNYTSVGWTGTSHTTDYVELAAFGPGSENLHGLVQNTALFGMMTRALGLTVPA